MAATAKIDVHDHDLNGAFKELARSILATEEIGAILVPRQLPMKPMVMPVLVGDPDQLEGMDPLAPAFALSAAKLVSRLTRKPAGEKLAVMLRPCEVRAFVELVKLKQGRPDDVLIISYDCPGAYANRDYMAFVRAWGRESTTRFLNNATEGRGAAIDGIDLAPACQACEHPVPENADLAVALFGIDTGRNLLIEARGTQGEAMLERLALAKAEMPAQRDVAVQSLIAARLDTRDRMMAETTSATDSLEKLTAYLANCVNCYNCRVACPVCYCRECVFVTDVFDHEPIQYLGWAKRKGAIKMPTDTVFYHLTRLAHMSTACVGCGQCSNACPNEVPVMELFRTVAQRTQAAFDYQAGKDAAERPPLSEFREKEFEDVVGIN
jgi:formate dehydrogenase (coenzyme F420) beta subunit